MTAPVLAATAWKTNAEMIEAVVQLGYLRADDHVLDPTWGRGTWWKNWQPHTLTATDLDPAKSPDPLGPVDFTDLPWPDATFDVVAFDPPYKLNGTPSDTDGIDERYGVGGGTYTRWQDRHQLIRDGITEAARVLKPAGCLLLKCQDQVCSGQVRWQTDEFTAHANTVGLVKVDRLEYLAHRPQPPGRRQIHSRRNYSTLLIFVKKGGAS